MNISSCRIAFHALLLTGAAAVLPAQTFLGSDNFDDNSLTIGSGNRWIMSYGLGSSAGTGTFSETGGVLNFSSTGDDTQFLRWSNLSTPGSDFTQDWTATIDVTNIVYPTEGYVTAGLQIYTLFNDGSVNRFNAYYSLMLLSEGNSSNLIVTEWAKTTGTALGSPVTNSIAFGDGTAVSLQLAWNASAQDLTARYSSNGIDFITGQVFDLNGNEAGYQTNLNNAFGLELFVRSAGGAGPLSTGGVSFDNMNVSAVPEPSTFAALLGLAGLGFASSRRRPRGITA